MTSQSQTLQAKSRLHHKKWSHALISARACIVCNVHAEVALRMRLRAFRKQVNGFTTSPISTLWSVSDYIMCWSVWNRSGKLDGLHALVFKCTSNNYESAANASLPLGKIQKICWAWYLIHHIGFLLVFSNAWCGKILELQRTMLLGYQQPRISKMLKL